MLNFIVIEIRAYCTFAQELKFIKSWKGIPEFLNSLKRKESVKQMELS